MKHSYRWQYIALMIICLLLSACARSTATQEHIQPVQLEEIEGTDLHRVILTERAAERLGIQTAEISNQIVRRTWTVGGVVVLPQIASATITAPIAGTVAASPSTANPFAGMQFAAGQVVLRIFPTIASNEGAEVVDVVAPGESALLRMLVAPGQIVEAGQALFEVVDTDEVWVQIYINESDLSNVDRSQPALISSLDADDEEDEGEESLEAEALDDLEGDDNGEDEDEDYATLFYVIDNTDHSLVLGQRVLVELSLSGSGATRQVVPYSAVIYDLQGNTWVYINPEPLVFVRQPVSIDYIVGDLAILSEGPDSGTSVATVGVAELYGADTGVGK